MARANRKATTARGAAEHMVSGAVGAAAALTIGVVQTTGRTLIETLHAVEEIGSELGSAVVRAARGSMKAAEDIGGDLVTVGKDVSRGVAAPMRQVGNGIARLTSGHWDGLAQKTPRKTPAKAAGRRRRRSAA
jgi:hypothetical protein